MNIKKDEYIILEVIPTHSNSDIGFIAQISALKIQGLKLVDRFDYRVDKELINSQDLLNMLNYDNDSFKYVNKPEKLEKQFKKFIKDTPLLIIENQYTLDYLKKIKNKKESIFSYLKMDLSDDVFDKLMNKYNLQPSNHLVDLLYEALLMEY